MPSQQLKDADYFIRILKQHLPEIREKYSVSYLGVFGSYVRGEQTSDSDLDILVEFDKTPGLLKYIELEYYLIYIPTPPLIFSLNFVDLVILALVDGDYFLQIIKNSRFLLPFQSKNL